jgi:hypothetical protein
MPPKRSDSRKTSRKGSSAAAAASSKDKYSSAVQIKF